MLTEAAAVGSPLHAYTSASSVGCVRPAKASLAGERFCFEFEMKLRRALWYSEDLFMRFFVCVFPCSGVVRALGYVHLLRLSSGFWSTLAASTAGFQPVAV